MLETTNEKGKKDSTIHPRGKNIVKDLTHYVKKYGFIKGVKTHMEMNFLEEKPLEEINDMFNQMSDRIDDLTGAIRGAIACSDLWRIPDDTEYTDESAGEGQTLEEMCNRFLELVPSTIKKGKKNGNNKFNV